MVKHTFKITYLELSSALAKAFSIVAFILLLLTIVPLIIPFFTNASSFGYIRTLLVIDQKVISFIKTNIPTIIAGKDLTRWFMGVGFFILTSAFSRMNVRFREKIQYERFVNNFDEWKTSHKLSESSIVLTPLNQKIELLKHAKRKDREELIKEFAETKRKLDEMGRDLAFLAIDIVDSTGMKHGEERPLVEHDFKEYKRFVERILQSHGCMKSTWTPDGVMSAFATVDAAVKAAREVINGLENFNKSVKYMKRDFMVRCGVNSGFVYFDEAVPLEEVSDRVIDIAGHMQKHALPNTVAVAKPTIEPLNERIGFEPSGRTVDGYEVYEWRKI